MYPACHPCYFGRGRNAWKSGYGEDYERALTGRGNRILAPVQFSVFSSMKIGGAARLPLLSGSSPSISLLSPCPVLLIPPLYFTWSFLQIYLSREIYRQQVS
jgi:hypothetical protein